MKVNAENHLIRRILLTKFIEARVMILDIPTQKSVTAVKLLQQRWIRLKSSVHEQFVHVWNALVHFDVEERALTIHNELES